MTERSETAISREIKRALEQIGIPVFRLQAGKVRVRGGWMQGNPEGTADLLAAPNLPGPALLWIEVKKPKGVISDEQLAFADRVRKRGHYHIFATGLDEVMAFLKDHNAR